MKTSRPLIEAKHHNLTVNIEDKDILLNADSVRLSQVISNLLNNAAKYTDPNGHISLKVTHSGETVLISIKDSGIGLSPEALPTIFELFAQVSEGIARSAGGLGIGLTIVRKLVEMHGGSVAVTSAGVGRGSEFLVRLPIVQHATDSKTFSKVEISKSSSRRILVVDDNLDSLESMGLLLEMYGHTVCKAVDGIEAVEVARSFKPDLMFLDLGLPGRDGFEVARILRKEFPQSSLTLVALSGYGQEEDRRRTRNIGFDHHLVKPVDMEMLEKVLAE